ncbi:hypothetical protein [Neolewinella agarilytica]|uniref:Uncharacterized protein n=1 Tax=Neolewinella agarilytica TaxID=478744 RepID=A0A1H9FU12_9BACT|nr:hypothetical protein [Neolewinella agarilytica]SEQ41432.1 hypothetical protein SAMN05444359_109103 [Neolewinella agarilytica]
MRSLMILLFVIPGITLFAQNAEKLWAGTTTVSIADSPEEGHGVQRVFYQSPSTEQGALRGITDGSIGQLMFRAFRDGRLAGYADEQLRQKVTKQDFEKTFIRKDTVQVIDPETYESRITVISRAPDPADYQSIELHLQLTYHSNGRLQQNPQWVSLSTDAGSPKVYFSVEPSSKAIDFDKDSWNAVDRMTFSVSLDALETERGSQLYKDKIFNHLFDQLNNKPAGGFRNADDWGILSAAQFDGLLHPKDTVTVIDPNTYESMDKVVDGIPFYEGIAKIRLLQFWAWDDAAARFVFSPVAYAPLEEFLDRKGGSVARPPFYWVEKSYRKR